jgi:hypothetical protein
VAEVGSVIERVPVTYLDRGDANGHGVLRADISGLEISRCAILSVVSTGGTGQ